MVDVWNFNSAFQLELHDVYVGEWGGEIWFSISYAFYIAFVYLYAWIFFLIVTALSLGKV